MIPDKKLKISFEEMSSRGAKIIALQPEIPLAEALDQVQRLKKSSKVSQSLKKGKKSP